MPSVMPRVLRFIVLGLFFIGLLGCSDEVMSPEQEIRAWIKQGVEAAEARDTDALVDMVKSDFKGRRNLDRLQLKKLIALQFFRSKNIFLFTKIQSIELPTTDTADVILHVAMAGSRISDTSMLSSLRAQIYRFELYLEKDDRWMLKEAGWEPGSVYDMQ